MQKQIDFSGPLAANIQLAREMLSQLETARSIEIEGFQELIQGSRLDRETLDRRAQSNFYLRAEEALKLGLIQGIVG